MRVYTSLATARDLGVCLLGMLGLQMIPEMHRLGSFIGAQVARVRLEVGVTSILMLPKMTLVSSKCLATYVTLKLYGSVMNLGNMPFQLAPVHEYLGTYRTGNFFPGWGN